MEIYWRVYDKKDGQSKEDCFSDRNHEVREYVTDIPDEELDDCVNDLERDELINKYIKADYNEWVDFVWTRDYFYEWDNNEVKQDENPLVT